ncbi:MULTISPECIES: deoxynucleoside kinase [unclassified Mycoplasma]|uniref:deoxynucleoside kinase n=1 Tax=unclassified Mycoplasma TaxID=2683645 RepID=UPI00211CA15B|nr:MULTISPECIES: deoxynucleoside kinase [unclassified Mycoplasma]UUM19641.1 deoxynucleoside kinase [Mycoplasma sp. 1578d]UUM24610.1 deoxynucleoside kinase [Mycoplasma sp. 3686d]
MLIGISGMISSGKSTLSKKLHKHYKKSLLLNEYEEDDVVFNTFLKWFYEKKANIDVSFQVYVVENHTASVRKILQEFEEKKLNKDEHIIFLDRFSAEHYVFASVNLKGYPRKSFNAYKALFNELVSNEELPEFTIFLDISFENFKKRLFKRGREVEINTYEQNEGYFNELYKVYKNVFLYIVKKYKINYVIIDTNDKSEKEVFEEAVKAIDHYKQTKTTGAQNE